MSATLWETAILFSKWLSYLAMLATPGAVFVAWLCRQVPEGRTETDRRLLSYYLLPAAVLGILASSAFFLFQVGAINQRGPGGMFDPVMAQILSQTALGEGLRWRLSGFFLALVAAGLWYVSRSLPGVKATPLILSWPVISILAGAALLCIAVSFTVLGHVSQLAIISQLMLVLHIAAVCLWAGSFIPLYVLCRDESRGAGDVDRPALHRVMVLFGQAVWVVLSALLISGLWLTWQFSDGFAGLLTSSYGRLLLLKLALVAGLMALSAKHKFRLVPALVSEGGGRLGRSIRVQAGLAALILLVTAIFTTFTGPVG